MMSKTNRLSWLCGKTWEQVTREERYFCAELFHAIRQDACQFVKFLNDKAERPGKEKRPEQGKDIPEKENWKAAYEICFYRDIRKWAERKGESKPKFSPKRTFDLALFSDDAIILIEAKAHQPFEGKQLKQLDGDRKNVAACTGVSEEMIFLVGLVSCKYRPMPKTKERFDRMTRWSHLASFYADNDRLACKDRDRLKRICCRANEIYRN